MIDRSDLSRIETLLRFRFRLILMMNGITNTNTTDGVRAAIISIAIVTIIAVGNIDIVLGNCIRFIIVPQDDRSVGPTIQSFGQVAGGNNNSL